MTPRPLLAPYYGPDSRTYHGSGQSQADAQGVHDIPTLLDETRHLGGRGRLVSADKRGVARRFSFRYRAWTREAVGDIAGAVADLAEGIRGRSQNKQEFSDRAELREMQADYNEAIAELERHLSTNPGSSKSPNSVERRADRTGCASIDRL